MAETASMPEAEAAPPAPPASAPAAPAPAEPAGGKAVLRTSSLQARLEVLKRGRRAP
jgi:hypothetical protein